MSSTSAPSGASASVYLLRRQMQAHGAAAVLLANGSGAGSAASSSSSSHLGIRSNNDNQQQFVFDAVNSPLLTNAAADAFHDDYADGYVPASSLTARQQYFKVHGSHSYANPSPQSLVAHAGRVRSSSSAAVNNNTSNKDTADQFVGPTPVSAYISTRPRPAALLADDGYYNDASYAAQRSASDRQQRLNSVVVTPEMAQRRAFLAVCEREGKAERREAAAASANTASNGRRYVAVEEEDYGGDAAERRKYITYSADAPDRSRTASTNTVAYADYDGGLMRTPSTTMTTMSASASAVNPMVPPHHVPTPAASQDVSPSRSRGERGRYTYTLVDHASLTPIPLYGSAHQNHHINSDDGRSRNTNSSGVSPRLLNVGTTTTTTTAAAGHYATGPSNNNNSASFASSSVTDLCTTPILGRFQYNSNTNNGGIGPAAAAVAVTPVAVPYSSHPPISGASPQKYGHSAVVFTGVPLGPSSPIPISNAFNEPQLSNVSVTMDDGNNTVNHPYHHQHYHPGNNTSHHHASHAPYGGSADEGGGEGGVSAPAVDEAALLSNTSTVESANGVSAPLMAASLVGSSPSVHADVNMVGSSAEMNNNVPAAHISSRPAPPPRVPTSRASRGGGSAKATPTLTAVSSTNVVSPPAVGSLSSPTAAVAADAPPSDVLGGVVAVVVPQQQQHGLCHHPQSQHYVHNVPAMRALITTAPHQQPTSVGLPTAAPLPPAATPSATAVAVGRDATLSSPSTAPPPPPPPAMTRAQEIAYAMRFNAKLIAFGSR